MRHEVLVVGEDDARHAASAPTGSVAVTTKPPSSVGLEHVEAENPLARARVEAALAPVRPFLQKLNEGCAELLPELLGACDLGAAAIKRVRHR